MQLICFCAKKIESDSNVFSFVQREGEKDKESQKNQIQFIAASVFFLALFHIVHVATLIESGCAQIRRSLSNEASHCIHTEMCMTIRLPLDLP